MPDFGKLKTLWFSGALLLLGLAAVLVVWFAVAALVLGVAAELLGYDSEPVFWSILYLVPLWGPIPAGYALAAMPKSVLQDAWIAGK